MKSYFEELSRKYRLFAETYSKKDDFSVSRKALIAPYALCEPNVKYYEAKTLKVKTPTGPIVKVHVRPLTTICYHEIDSNRQRNKYEASKERETILAYVPMIVEKRCFCKYDYSYKSLVKAIDDGIKRHFIEEEYRKHYRETLDQDLPRKYEDMPAEWRKSIRNKIRNFVSKIDAYEIVENLTPNFLEVEDGEVGIPYALIRVDFYAFKESPADKMALREFANRAPSEAEKDRG